MKKIIIPFDGNDFSEGAFSFARSLHEIKPILLTGVFLPTVDYARFFLFPAAFASPIYIPLSEKNSSEEGLENTVERFIHLCERNLIEYRVHKDLYELAIPQLKKETRFADLMIIGSETFYKSGIAYASNEYLKDALHGAECPVIIVSEKFTVPSHIILAYDGSASSVFAIKQFACLLPELCNLQTILIFAGDHKETIPDQALIEELAARHFKDLSITKLTSDNKNDTNKWLVGDRNPLIVSGSFGRSNFSELFSRSFTMNVIKDHRAPVFIAHQ